MKKKVLHFRRNKRSLKSQRIQKNKKAKIIPDPADFDIQEVGTISDRETEKGGTVKPWEPLETQEKIKMRGFLTYCTVLLWLSWTAIGLIDFLFTGNPFLLVTSPPIGGLLFLIFKFYFK